MSKEMRLALSTIEADTCSKCEFLPECDGHESKVCYQKTRAKMDFLKKYKISKKKE
jgi:hypothetical protein